MLVYAYKAEMFCSECIHNHILPEIRDYYPERIPTNPDNENTWDSDDYPKLVGEASEMELDYYAHCGICGAFLDNALPRDGIEHIIESLDTYSLYGRGRLDILEEWAIALKQRYDSVLTDSQQKTIRFFWEDVENYYSEKGQQWAKSAIDGFGHSFALVEAIGGDCPYCSSYVGKVFSITPSGKYYMPWTSNQTRSDVIHDQAFWRGAEYYLEEQGYWVEPGEGDPTDIFICRLPTQSEALAYLAHYVEKFLSKDIGFSELEQRLFLVQDSVDIPNIDIPY